MVFWAAAALAKLSGSPQQTDTPKTSPRAGGGGGNRDSSHHNHDTDSAAAVSALIEEQLRASNGLQILCEVISDSNVKDSTKQFCAEILCNVWDVDAILSHCNVGEKSVINKALQDHMASKRAPRRSSF